MNLIVPLSPLTNSSNVIKHCSFSVTRICNDYSKMGINVERFFKSDLVDLYECVDSGYRFYYPFSCIGDAAFYVDLSLNRTNYYSVRWEHGVALKYLKSNDSVLEIGSGFGAFLNRIKLENIKGKGLELNPFAVKQCIQNGLNVKERLINDEVSINANSYSIVCCFQVLEHITDVNSFIASSIKLLKENGKLIIGVPNNNPYLFVNDKYHTLNLPPHHAGLWNKKALKYLEQIFPIMLVSLEFEPLNVAYTDFLNVQLKNANFLTRFVIRISHQVMPNILKKILCKYVKGRNILAVFEKVE
ncbi:class I SAM-dependent methyltransferase [Hwangdonia lutea]|uniref:Methyltransferase domain-containing protein n=1 Tax=Hwangdonia lutea TaxID=3075823 RepID=A0AA97HRZ0_9FLAO|nr:methyltransferase domain-containing protein [Hwangdonia sp. SCSIO 19198]WOD43983.1 methyltransferase domain-containing protein [Hwangdonia sp. SCSIO 19198]